MRKMIYLFTCLFAFCGNAVAAPISAVDFSSFTTNNGDGPWTLGFEFSTNTDVNLTHLGSFDFNQDGFVVSHDVGLWDAAGKLLVSTTVNSSDTLNGYFRYKTISSILLKAGESYFVGANGYGGSYDTYALTAPDLTTASAVNYITSAYNTGSSLELPSDFGNDSGYYGANFMFEAVSVPEPISLALIALGLVGISFSQKRKLFKENSPTI